MLRLPSADDALALRSFFHEADYTKDGIEKALIIVEGTARQMRTLPRMLERTREVTPLNILIRWFTLGVAVPEGVARSVAPPEILRILLECGLIEQQGEDLAPMAFIAPFFDLLIATDFTLTYDSLAEDTVLGINAVTWVVYRFMIQQPSATTLDLGSGCGVLGLAAASWSGMVTAVDINPRATNFEQFNARLNGINNFEALTGNAFEPVAGRQFHSIVMNPPFYISPHSRFVFCDNQMPGDEFSRALVRAAPAHLQEGGYCQLICEWIQRKGENWEDRVREWLEGTGCDAWVIRGHSWDPGKYAQDRIRETTAYSPENDAVLYAEYSRYLRDLGTEAIHRGLITMRKRSGPNWLRLESPTALPKESYGDSIRQGFEAMDFLEKHRREGTLESTRLLISPHARLDQRLRFESGQWRISELHLHNARGLPYLQKLQPMVGQFLNLFDGTRTTGEAVEMMLRITPTDPVEVRQECYRILTLLVERGFLVPA